MENKCEKCDQKWQWYYETKETCGLYCDEHLPCGKFKRFIGKYIAPILMEASNYLLVIK
jgi:hypothetical protein